MTLTNHMSLVTAYQIVSDVIYIILPWMRVWETSKPQLESFLIGDSLNIGIV